MTLELTSSPPRPCARSRRRTAARRHRPGDHRPDRRRSVPRPRGRRRQLVGPRHRSARCAPCASRSTSSPATACRSASIGCWPTSRSPPAAPSRSWCRPRLDGVRRRADQLGGQSPTPSRVRRHGRRPTFAAAPRRWRRRRVEGAVARPRGMAVHSAEHFTAAPRRRPAGRPRHRRDRRAVPVVVRRLARPAVRSRMAARGTFGAAVSALLWAGLVRICVLHHATWSVNSVCHMFGRRPFATKDRSTNVAALAVSAWVSRGTTATTRSRARYAMGCSAGNGTPRRC